MKILYLIKSFAAKAGTERVLSDKMNWLADRGCQVFLVTFEQGNHTFAFPINKDVVHYDINTPFFKIGEYSFLKKLMLFFILRKRFHKRLQRIVDDVCPDIIITTSYSIYLFDIILRIRTNSKRLIESHVACDKVCKSAFMSHKNVLYILSVIYDKYFLSYVRGFDGLIALTNRDAKDWSSYNNNVYVIPNPVPCLPLEAASVGNNKRIICVGRLHKQKGFDLLIRAFSLISDKCQEWKIDIYGEGGEKSALEDLILLLNLEGRIVINAPTENIHEEYLKSGFLVLSSRYEGFGMVLLEAMSCGLPCVSFDCPYGPNEIIEDGVNGFLVENGNINKLAECILLMIKNEKRRTEMGVAARRSIMQYEKSVIMNKWMNLFDYIL